MIVCFALMASFSGCDKNNDVTGVSLDKTTLTLNVGKTEMLTATIVPSDATNTRITWNSNKPTTATVENGVVTAVAVGTATITVTTDDGSKTATCIVTVVENDSDKEWVEINGVKWATRNVDMPCTFAANPEDAGMFYQWNRNIGWSSTNPMINSNGGTTWDDSFPNGETWEKANDPSPAGYRVPNKTEIEKLLDADKVTTEWITENAVIGRRFTDKVNGNSIFLPAAGYRSETDGGFRNVGTYGSYWSSSSNQGSVAGYVYGLGFVSNYVGLIDYSNRVAADPVRPVVE